ncbi:MAG: hemolysin secretion protein [Hyphomicrobiales bacterium]|nr:hemolysin secretion protein [Hyphomicrobiales bacterium]
MSSFTMAASGYSRSIGQYRRTGFTLILVVASTFGLWAATAPLSSAIVAAGHFEVDGNIKKVQHQIGGIVSEILVREGQRVAEGELLLRLDATAARSNLLIVERQLDELWMSAARLAAERDGLTHFDPPGHFDANAQRPTTVMLSLFESNERLLAARLEARLGQQEQLTQRVAQLDNQISGLTTQSDAKKRERELLKRELTDLHALFKKNLVPVTRINDLERETARLDGEIGQLQSSAAELRGKIAETKLQSLNLDQVAVADAGKELWDTESKISELSQKQVEAKDVMSRVDIRSPRTGIVHQLNVHTIGGVVGPGETLMMIVPEMSQLNIEARIGPQDVDSIHLGDKAVIRISGLNRSTTPDLDATVNLIGADLVQDPSTHISYYPISVRLDPGQVERLNGTPLVPGMPVDTFINTSKRTFADYLIEPLMDRMSRAIREK